MTPMKRLSTVAAVIALLAACGNRGAADAANARGNGHFGQRIAFDRDGMLWISSSERQEFDPAQDMSANLGKIVRLKDDGSAPADNPFADRGGVSAQIWTLGHRNVLGLAFDANGQLGAHEMGPKGGLTPEAV